MKIAILGWGGLIWDQQNLPIAGQWQKGGPKLRIEFSRISDDRRLTLVIDETHGVNVPVRFAASARADLDDAISDLQNREKTKDPDNIGVFDRHSNLIRERAQSKHPEACKSIRAWAEKEQFDAVIWTAIEPRFREELGVTFSLGKAMEYVNGLPSEARAKAFEYIRNAPEEVSTPFRSLFEHTQKQDGYGPVQAHQATTAQNEPNPSIHLSQLTLRRFRSCDDVTVTFQPDLTVLVGENNGGKSNIIDAIRLLTLPLSGRRERYPEDEDVRRGASTANFEIVGQYRGLSDTLKGLLITAVPDPTEDAAIFGYRYEPRSDNAPRGRTTFWVGKFDSAEPEAGAADLIRHVYLPALRDAHQALGSGSGARVMALFRHFLPKEKETDFLKDVQRGEFLPDVLTTMNREIGTALSALTSGVRPQQARLDFRAESLLDVARSLRFKLSDAGMTPEEIRASGLGYSNLLYMATVVVELAKAKEADLTLLLVEEPEAHLHPQLQMLVLEFLLESAKNSINATTPLGKPEGRIQAIVSTHSPNLTAWVSPKHLVVVRSQRVEIRSHAIDGLAGAKPVVAAIAENTSSESGKGNTSQGRMVAPQEENLPAQEVPLSRTVVVPIAELGLDQKTLDKIGRYLDVTRSALLFGNKALLVEGIAESLLLPVIARRHVLKGKDNEWMRFKGTVIVPIEGVDFRPYVEILVGSKDGARIADRVVVVTDADPSVEGNRKEDLEKLAVRLGAGDVVHVYTNQHTLEHELFNAGNEALLRRAFLTLHPRSANDWAMQIESAAQAVRADAFLTLITEKRTRKGDLAQRIALCIEEGDLFNVPDYLKQAIEKTVAL